MLPNNIEVINLYGLNTFRFKFVNISKKSFYKKINALGTSEKSHHYHIVIITLSLTENREIVLTKRIIKRNRYHS